VIDPSDSELLAGIPGQVTFHDPHQVPDADTARFVPRDPGDRDTYEALYRWVFEHFPRYVLLDEAGIAAPANGSPPWVRTVVIQGRKRSIGHVACHTRPREVDKNLIAQAQHVLVFGCVDPDDRKHLAAQIGLPADELTTALAELDPFEYLWWRQRERVLMHCPALDPVR
jgi:DNA helicase HerA-like ATPase